MEQQAGKTGGNGNGGAGNVATNITGTLTTGGVAIFIIQQQAPFEYKMLYLALLTLAGFAAILVRFQMAQQQKQQAKQAEVLEALLMESRIHCEYARLHDNASVDAHKTVAAAQKRTARIQYKSAATLTALVAAVDRICNNGFDKPKAGDES